ncbi:MAG: peptidoglycan-binding domain-containing protein, partial [Cyanobacteria bacterium J06598_1]
MREYKERPSSRGSRGYSQPSRRDTSPSWGQSYNQRYSPEQYYRPPSPPVDPTAFDQQPAEPEQAAGKEGDRTKSIANESGLMVASASAVSSIPNIAQPTLRRLALRVLGEQVAKKGSTALIISTSDGPLPFGDAVALMLMGATVIQGAIEIYGIWQEVKKLYAEEQATGPTSQARAVDSVEAALDSEDYSTYVAATERFNASAALEPFRQAVVIEALQQKFLVPRTGEYDAETARAVFFFQKYEMGLAANADGILGPDTFQAIAGLPLETWIAQHYPTEIYASAISQFYSSPGLENFRYAGVVGAVQDYFGIARTEQYDEQTAQQVYRFQQEQMGLADADGILGPDTFEAIAGKTLEEWVTSQQVSEPAAVETVEDRARSLVASYNRVQTMISDRADLLRYTEPEVLTAVQQHLNISETGLFDFDTFLAVQAYQQENGLAVDGVLGPSTFTAIAGQPLQAWLATLPIRVYPGGSIAGPLDGDANNIDDLQVGSTTALPSGAERVDIPPYPGGIPLDGPDTLDGPEPESIPQDDASTENVLIPFPFPNSDDAFIPYLSMEEAEASLEEGLGRKLSNEEATAILAGNVAREDIEQLVATLTWVDVKNAYLAYPELMDEFLAYRSEVYQGILAEVKRIIGVDLEFESVDEQGNFTDSPIRIIDAGSTTRSSDRDLIATSSLPGNISVEIQAVIEFNRLFQERFRRTSGVVFDVNIYTLGHMPKTAFGQQAEELTALREIQSYLALPQQISSDEQTLLNLEDGSPRYNEMLDSIIERKARLGSSKVVAEMNGYLRQINGIRAQRGESNTLPENIEDVNADADAININAQTQTAFRATLTAISNESSRGAVSSSTRNQIVAGQDVYGQLKQRRNMSAQQWEAEQQRQVENITNDPLATATAQRFETVEQLYQQLISELAAEQSVQSRTGASESDAEAAAYDRLHEYYLLQTQSVYQELEQLRGIRAGESETQAEEMTTAEINQRIDQLTLDLNNLRSRALFFANEAYHTRSAAVDVVLNQQIQIDVPLTAAELLVSINEQIGFAVEQLHADSGLDADYALGQAITNSSKYLHRAAKSLKKLSESLNDQELEQTSPFNKVEIDGIKDLFEELENIKRGKEDAYGITDSATKLKMIRALVSGTKPFGVDFNVDNLEELETAILDFSRYVNVNARPAISKQLRDFLNQPDPYLIEPELNPSAPTNETYKELYDELRSSEIDSSQIF